MKNNYHSEDVGEIGMRPQPKREGLQGNIEVLEDRLIDIESMVDSLDRILFGSPDNVCSDGLLPHVEPSVSNRIDKTKHTAIQVHSKLNSILERL